MKTPISNNSNLVRLKQVESNEIQKSVSEFVKSGGVITKLPSPNDPSNRIVKTAKVVYSGSQRYKDHY